MLLQIRLKTLLDTCTYVVFNYTRRGLFDRDKLIVLTLLTFHIMLKVTRPCPSSDRDLLLRNASFIHSVLISRSISTDP